MSGRILVVDDESDLVDTYRMWLEEEGYELRGEANAAAALATMASWRPHAVLLDQRLEGGGGRDVGLSLIRRLSAVHPPARILVVTAYATRATVERAFHEGASDYLEKRDILESMLRVKLRDHVAAAQRVMEADDEAAREDLLRQTWADAKSEPNPQRKGALLEQAVRRLLESVPGFTHARTNVRNPLEEIDVVVANRSSDPLLQRQGDYLLIECKNWSGVVGKEVIKGLRDKVRERFGRSKLGICVAMGGFAKTAHEELRTIREGDVLLLLLDAEDLDAWIAAADRADWLVGRLQQAVVAG